MPLPPILERAAQDPRSKFDDERYQTVYADYNKQVAVAAPTAGLQLPPFSHRSILTRHQVLQMNFTFAVRDGNLSNPQVDQIEDHPIHNEWYEISKEILRSLQSDGPGLRAAVGTTSVRSIEDAMRYCKDEANKDISNKEPFRAEAKLFLYPPAQFQAVDHLITNFHLPKSNPFPCLVVAFLDPNGNSRHRNGCKKLIKSG